MIIELFVELNICNSNCGFFIINLFRFRKFLGLGNFDFE